MALVRPGLGYSEPAVELEDLEAVGCSQTLAGGGRCVMAVAIKAKHMPAGLLRRKEVDIFGLGGKVIAFLKCYNC